MTTFTTEDKEQVYKQLLEEAPRHVGYEDAVVNVEPIPFMGMVQLQDKEDREQMLREQIHILQAECQRLRKRLRDLGQND
jgi:hypothetical protein